MKTANEIKQELKQFTGTIGYTRYNPVLFPDVLLTEGAEYVADACGAYWLMDMISSHIKSMPSDEYYAIATLMVDGGEGRFLLADDSPATAVYAMQDISYTDFPLDEVKLYVIREGDEWVILLPSEY